jgi:transcriptional regulator with XRE-family HTH domain
VGVTTIIRIERNQVEPQGSTIRKLAGALSVAPEELVKTEG